ncbi:hypothetical protein COO91_10048 (plasmid) [Nostoc flagelliforme CCNUN1]|uniref:Uncharacterized protein n=2 Tax=Nostoc flagelliforme TaxID=1306274 RepID=A0A2K8T863_9NOSO|nr:hypothetical protein COO91_10048 [Nostoc flagelliforme CCNUN1]
MNMAKTKKSEKSENAPKKATIGSIGRILGFYKQWHTFQMNTLWYIAELVIECNVEGN